MISPELPNTLRLTVGIAVFLGLAALWLLLRPGRVHFLPWNRNARQLLCGFGLQLGVETPFHASGVVLGKSSRAAIAFRRFGPVLLGLFDPTGDEVDCISTIWRLRDLAQQEGLDAAVWGAGPGLLRIYSDLGLTPFALGVDGMPMSEFNGERPSTTRYLVCKAEQDLNRLLPILPDLAAEYREALALSARGSCT